MGKILNIGSGKTYEASKKVWEAKDENLLAKLDESKIKITEPTHWLPVKSQRRLCLKQMRLQ